MIRSTARRFESVLGDLRLGIDSRRSTPLDFERRKDLPLGKNADARGFEPLSHRAARHGVDAMQLRPNDVVVVYGAGKGRTVCHFARARISRVVGIEIERDLCESARRNAERLRGRRAEIEIRNEDAAVARVDDATACFMFNPFGPRTLLDVLGHLRAAAERSPEPLRIVYMNARYREVIDHSGWMKLTRAYTLHGSPVAIYTALAR